MAVPFTVEHLESGASEETHVAQFNFPGLPVEVLVYKGMDGVPVVEVYAPREDGRPWARVYVNDTNVYEHTALPDDITEEEMEAGRLLRERSNA